jgi:hypothetical protein
MYHPYWPLASTCSRAQRAVPGCHTFNLPRRWGCGCGAHAAGGTRQRRRGARGRSGGPPPRNRPCRCIDSDVTPLRRAHRPPASGACVCRVLRGYLRRLLPRGAWPGVLTWPPWLRRRRYRAVRYVAYPAPLRAQSASSPRSDTLPARSHRYTHSLHALHRRPSTPAAKKSTPTRRRLHASRLRPAPRPSSQERSPASAAATARARGRSTTRPVHRLRDRRGQRYPCRGRDA